MNDLKLIRLILIFIMLGAASQSKGQLNYAGKKFFITCGGGNMFPNSQNFDVMLSGKHHATVQFYYHFTSMGGMPPTTYTINPGTVTRVRFSSYQMWALSNIYFDQVMNRSLEITSDSNIIVQIVDREGCADDGTTVLPTDQQKKAWNYLLLTLGDRMMNSSTLSFSIVSTCDSTIVQIIPKTNTHTHQAGVPFIIVLNKGETYQLSTPGTSSVPANTNRDLSGTTVNVLYSKADVPINIFCHTGTAYCPPHTQTTPPIECCADKFMEQILPVEWMDTIIPVIPIYTREQSRVKMVSAYTNNPIYFDGTYIKTLDAGEIIDTTVDEAFIIHAQKPIAVAKFMLSEGYSNIMDYDGDPDMFWELSPSQGIRESYFKLFSPLAITPVGISIDRVVVSIVSPDSLVNNIELDGNTIASYFQPFPSAPGWQYAHVPIDSTDTMTVHHITAPAKILAYFQRIYRQGGYSFNLSDVNVDSVAAYSGLVSVYDTVYKCTTVPVTLSAPNSPLYEWSTGAATVSISVIDTGIYWVRDIIQYPCHSVPAIKYFLVKDTQASMITGIVVDTVAKCKNSPVILTATSALKYEWYNGDTVQQIQVADTGMFYVNEIWQEDACEKQQILHQFFVSDFFIDYDLGADTTACTGDQIYLTTPFASTIWSTGDTGKAIVVTEQGDYSASYTDSCNIQHHDTISVYFNICPEKYCDIVFPTAFSPNNDSKNDLFKPITYGLFTSYELAIYDRWGKLVFKTLDKADGWNGTLNGVPVELGVYMFFCRVTCPAKGTQLIKGDVTLIR